MPNSWSELVLSHRTAKTFRASERFPGANRERRFSDRHLLRFRTCNRNRVSSKLEWRYKECVGDLLRLSLIQGASIPFPNERRRTLRAPVTCGEAMTGSAEMLTLGAYLLLRLRTCRNHLSYWRPKWR